MKVVIKSSYKKLRDKLSGVINVKEVVDVNKSKSSVIDGKVSIRHYSSSITRVNLKYQNYEAEKVEVVRETSSDSSYEVFYQPAVQLLIKMYEVKKLA